MIKFGDRIFNSRKKQPDTGEQDDRAHCSELAPELQEKQAEQHGNNSEKRVEKNIVERLKETTKLNERVHAAEFWFKGFNKMLRAGIVATALAMSPGVAQSGQQESHGESNNDTVPVLEISDKTHEKQIYQNVQKIIEVLSRKFNNAEEIVRACGGVMRIEIFQEDENAPILIHIAQNHGADNFRFNPGMYLSQYYATRCMVSMIKGNATGKVIPIGFELLTSSGSNEERLEGLVSHSLGKMMKFKGHGGFYFLDKNKEFNDHFFNQFPYPVGPGQLQDLEQPIISIMKQLVPEEMVSEVDSILTEARYILSEENIDINTVDNLERIVSKLMTILHQIERDHGVRFTVVDPPATDKMLGEKNNFGEFYKEVYTKREKHVAGFMDDLVSAYNSAGFGIFVYGSGHDFRKDAFNAGMNLMRIETAPLNVHDGMSAYKIPVRSEFDDVAAKCGMPVAAADVEKWIMEQGGAAQAKEHLINTRQFDFLFDYLHQFQFMFQSVSEEFTSDELFAIIMEDAGIDPHEWGHRLHGDPDKLKHYLTPEQFTAIKEKVEKCAGHYESYDTRCDDRIYLKERVEYRKRFLSSLLPPEGI